ncbi:E3 ubiquitin-protein ligase SMURF1 [Microtus ochrogaster]|uniref:E3 ubiquitin-protein ligase n=1 Tax=Microtus ochrogaster TaxID=79684 RepID=A0A8J6GK75_MICOH|nr:E3 ubiquitin-protein ligase SMURF1 [Microtus ochrogaster]
MSRNPELDQHLPAAHSLHLILHPSHAQPWPWILLPDLVVGRTLLSAGKGRLPDPFAKIVVDGSGQCHSTDTVKNTLDPKWNQHYDLYVGKTDSITISVWNHKKIHKKQGAGFLGCVRLLSNAISRLKDTGYQRLDLCKLNPSDTDAVRGQIVVSLQTRDRIGSGGSVVDCRGLLENEGTVYEDSGPGRPLSCLMEEPAPYTDGTGAAAGGGNCRFVESPNQDQRLQVQRLRNAEVRGSLQTPQNRPHGHQSPELPEGYAANGLAVPSTAVPSTAVPSTAVPSAAVPSAAVPSTAVPSVAVPSTAVPSTAVSSAAVAICGTVCTPAATSLQMWYSVLTCSHITEDAVQCAHCHHITSVHTCSHITEDAVRHITEDAVQCAHCRHITSVHTCSHITEDAVQCAHCRHITSVHTCSHITEDAAQCAHITEDVVRPLGTIPGGDEAFLYEFLLQGHTSEPSHQCQLKEPSQPLQLPSEGSMEDEELPAQRYERDLVQKLKVLRHELSLQQPQAGHCRIEVSREEIFEESYRQIMKMRPKDLKKRLMVKFRGEEGLDYGGVAREWLYLLCHEMLNPYYGLFQYSTDDIYTLQINPDSSVNPDHLSYFHFVGRIMGLAVFHGHYINGGFTVPFYKQLLGKPIQLSDLESVDPELHKSLVWILENDITPVLDHTFCVEHNAFGRILQHELKPNGRNVPVTEENKKEYVRLYVNWRFMRGIEAQFLALQKGFNELIPQHLLKPFDQKELELIIGGLDKIDLNDWKSNTRLKHCVADSNIVRWFWQAVETFDEERRARLLQFVTGSTRVPLQGFKALQGSTGAAGPRLFTIHLIDANTDNLPKAHTCFNRIDIPPYESYEKLYEKLLTAVEETCGFAVE